MPSNERHAFYVECTTGKTCTPTPSDSISFDLFELFYNILKELYINYSFLLLFIDNLQWRTWMSNNILKFMGIVEILSGFKSPSIPHLLRCHFIITIDATYSPQVLELRQLLTLFSVDGIVVVVFHYHSSYV
jgi:hypothetical protein